MSDLTDFLLARIAEDEEVARAASGGAWTAGPIREPADAVWVGDDPALGIVHASWEIDGATPANVAHIARHDPARVLAECAAKRRIVEECLDAEQPDNWTGEEQAGALAIAAPTLRALALPYADHPDYREEWAL